MPACMFCTTFLVGIATLHPFASVTSSFCIATTIVCVVETDHSRQCGERERELYNTFSHEPQFLVPGNSVRGRPLSVLWLSDSALSLSPWCPWRSGMKRDTTTRSPCGLFEYFNWVASAAASKLNYPDYLF